MNLSYLQTLRREAEPLIYTTGYRTAEKLRLKTCSALRDLELNTNRVSSLGFPTSAMIEDASLFLKSHNELMSILEYNISLLESRGDKNETSDNEMLLEHKNTIQILEALVEEKDSEISNLKLKIRNSQEHLKTAQIEIDKLAGTIKNLIL